MPVFLRPFSWWGGARRPRREKGLGARRPEIGCDRGMRITAWGPFKSSWSCDADELRRFGFYRVPSGSGENVPGVTCAGGGSDGSGRGGDLLEARRGFAHD